MSNISNEHYEKIDKLIYSKDPLTQNQGLSIIEALDAYTYLKKVSNNNPPYCIFGLLSKYGFSVSSRVKFQDEYIPMYFENIPRTTTLYFEKGTDDRFFKNEDFIRQILCLSSIELYFKQFIQVAHYLEKKPNIQSDIRSISILDEGGWNSRYDEDLIEDTLMNGTSFPKLICIQTKNCRWEGLFRYKGQKFKDCVEAIHCVHYFSTFLDSIDEYRNCKEITSNGITICLDSKENTLYKRIISLKSSIGYTIPIARCSNLQEYKSNKPLSEKVLSSLLLHTKIHTLNVENCTIVSGSENILNRIVELKFERFTGRFQLWCLLKNLTKVTLYLMQSTGPEVINILSEAPQIESLFIKIKTEEQLSVLFRVLPSLIHLKKLVISYAQDFQIPKFIFDMTKLQEFSIDTNCASQKNNALDYFLRTAKSEVSNDTIQCVEEIVQNLQDMDDYCNEMFPKKFSARIKNSIQLMKKVTHLLDYVDILPKTIFNEWNSTTQHNTYKYHFFRKDKFSKETVQKKSKENFQIDYQQDGDFFSCFATAVEHAPSTVKRLQIHSINWQENEMVIKKALERLQLDTLYVKDPSLTSIPAWLCTNKRFLVDISKSPSLIEIPKEVTSLRVNAQQFESLIQNLSSYKYLKSLHFTDWKEEWLDVVTTMNNLEQVSIQTSQFPIHHLYAFHHVSNLTIIRAQMIGNEHTYQILQEFIKSGTNKKLELSPRMQVWFASRKIQDQEFIQEDKTEELFSNYSSVTGNNFNKLKRIKFTDITHKKVNWTEILERFSQANTIYLSDNELNAFPSELVEFPMVDVRLCSSLLHFPDNVRGLGVNDAQLRALFLEIENYNNLEDLSINEFQASYLPYIKKLPNLKTLRIRKRVYLDQLQNIPVEVLHVPKLKLHANAETVHILRQMYTKNQKCTIKCSKYQYFLDMVYVNTLSDTSGSE